MGTPPTRGDLEACLARPVERWASARDDDTVFTTPLPTHGLASLLILALFGRLRAPRGEGFEHVHGIVEATKRAFAVRDRVITDPDRKPHLVERYLAAPSLDREALAIDRHKAAPWHPPAAR